MRIACAIVALVVGAAAPAVAVGQEPPPLSSITPDGGDVPVDEGNLTRGAELDQLFTALLTTTDDDAARKTEERIIELWMESGSDTIDLLMQWAIQAMEAEDYPLALDFLDRITTLKPDYAEGWNKRATVYFLMDDYGKSLADIERVLVIEPRHFAALSGLGMILRAVGDDQRAGEAYKRALDLDPHLDSAEKALEEINAGGRGI